MSNLLDETEPATRIEKEVRRYLNDQVDALTQLLAAVVLTPEELQGLGIQPHWAEEIRRDLGEAGFRDQLLEWFREREWHQNTHAGFALGALDVQLDSPKLINLWKEARERAGAYAESTGPDEEDFLESWLLSQQLPAKEHTWLWFKIQVLQPTAQLEKLRREHAAKTGQTP